MSDIFFSYAREDRGRAESLARALQSEGWSVWWDRTIPAGQTFDAVIERNLDAARCVIVLWSTRSVASEWVRTEAQEGENRGILVPILIDKVKIPLAFRRIQAADLVGWQGDKTAPEYSQLVTDIKTVLAAHPNSNGSSKVNPSQSEVFEFVGAGSFEGIPHSQQVEGRRGSVSNSRPSQPPFLSSERHTPIDAATRPTDSSVPFGSKRKLLACLFAAVALAALWTILGPSDKEENFWVSTMIFVIFSLTLLVIPAAMAAIGTGIALLFRRRWAFSSVYVRCFWVNWGLSLLGLFAIKINI